MGTWTQKTKPSLSGSQKQAAKKSSSRDSGAGRGDQSRAKELRETQARKDKQAAAAKASREKDNARRPATPIKSTAVATAYSLAPKAAPQVKPKPAPQVKAKAQDKPDSSKFANFFSFLKADRDSPVGSVWGGSPHERNRDTTERLPTSTGAGMQAKGQAHYPTGKAKELDLKPDSPLGWLSAAVNPMGSMIKDVGKVFMNQVNYGMNDRAKVEFDKLLKDPANKDMSTLDLVTLARKPQIDEQLNHAFIDNPTTDNQREAIRAGLVDPRGLGGGNNNSGNSGMLTGAPQAPNIPPPAPTLGQLTTGNPYTGGQPQDRPSWAPALGHPNASPQPWAPQWTPQAPMMPPAPQVQPQGRPSWAPQWDNRGMFTNPNKQ